MFDACKKTKEEATEKFKAQQYEEAAKLYVEGAVSAKSLRDIVKAKSEQEISEHKKYIQFCY